MTEFSSNDIQRLQLLSTDDHHRAAMTTTTHSLVTPDHDSRSLPSFRIFVHPPEEEYLPSVCAFDAADHPATESDEELNDSGCDINGHIPGVAREAYYGHESYVAQSHRRTIDGRSIEDVLAAAEEDYELTSDEDSDEPDTTIRSPPGADDSEVIEVVKVRRRGQTEDVDTPQPVPLPRPSSFMGKASRVFSSFKSKSKAKTAQKPSDPTPAPAPAASLRDRKSSLTLGRMFNRSSETSAKRKQSVSSLSSAVILGDDTPPSADALGSSQSDDTRSPSPALSTNTTSRRRVSVLSIIPNFSSAPKPTPIDRQARSSASSSLSSDESTSDCPTPGETSSLHTNKVRRSFSFMRKRAEKPVAEPVKIAQPAPVMPVADEDGDNSMEMRLDSLYFDDLSFDAGKF